MWMKPIPPVECEFENIAERFGFTRTAGGADGAGATLWTELLRICFT